MVSRHRLKCERERNFLAEKAFSESFFFTTFHEGAWQRVTRLLLCTTDSLTRLFSSCFPTVGGPILFVSASNNEIETRAGRRFLPWKCIRRPTWGKNRGRGLEIGLFKVSRELRGQLWWKLVSGSDCTSWREVNDTILEENFRYQRNWRPRPSFNSSFRVLVEILAMASRQIHFGRPG